VDAGTLLLGAGVALGSAALGVVSETLKGWFGRRYSIADKRTVFRHRTAVELQETIYQLMRTTGAIHHADTTAARQSGVWGRTLASNDLNEAHNVQVIRIRVLMERLEDAPLRQNIDVLISGSASVVIARTEQAALDANETLMKRHKEVNKELGRAIRETWPN